MATTPPTNSQDSISGRVLIVAATDARVRAVARNLFEMGFEIATAASSGEALRKVGKDLPSATVLDASLEDAEILRCYTALRGRDSGQNMPIAFTNSADPGGKGPSTDLFFGPSAQLDEIARALRERSASDQDTSTRQIATEPPPESETVGGDQPPPPSTDDSQPPVVAPPRDVPPPGNQELGGALLEAVARRWWLALLILGAVMVADLFYTMTRERTYLARTSLIISPSADVERGSLVYSVDSLGRGRIVGTYAEVLGSELVHREALERLGYPVTALNTLVTFKSSTVADTAVVQVSAESPDPVLSAEAANRAGEVGIERMTGLFPVYNLVFLSRAIPPPNPYRPDPIRNYSLGLLFGIVLAVAVSYLYDSAANRLNRVRRSSPPTPKRVQPASTSGNGQSSSAGSTRRPAVAAASAGRPNGASRSVAPVAEPRAVGQAPAAPNGGPSEVGAAVRPGAASATSVSAEGNGQASR